MGVVNVGDLHLRGKSGIFSHIPTSPPWRGFLMNTSNGIHKHTTEKTQHCCIKSGPERCSYLGKNKK